MISEYIINSKHLTDIKPLFAGKHSCPSNYSYGPHIRQCYLIHFCFSGKGIFKNPRGSYPVCAGEMFVIRKNEVTLYQADEINPWEYMWIGFDGDLAFLFEEAEAVYKIPAGLLEKITNAVNKGECSAHIYSSVIFELIYELLPKEQPLGDTLSAVKNYVKYNYMNEISVESIALHFGFERSYLYRKFKSRYGVGLKEYLTRTRMEVAKRLLEEGHPVRIVAGTVGYRDEFNFSKAFKNCYKKPPIAYKNSSKQSDN